MADQIIETETTVTTKTTVVVSGGSSHSTVFWAFIVLFGCYCLSLGFKPNNDPVTIENNGGTNNITIKNER